MSGGSEKRRRFCRPRPPLTTQGPELLAILPHIAVAGSARMPMAPCSSTKVHSAAIRLTTSSGVDIDAIPPHPETQPDPIFTRIPQITA